MDKLLHDLKSRIDEGYQEWWNYCSELGWTDKDDFSIVIGLSEAELILEELYRLQALEK